MILGKWTTVDGEVEAGWGVDRRSGLVRHAVHASGPRLFRQVLLMRSQVLLRGILLATLGVMAIPVGNERGVMGQEGASEAPLRFFESKVRPILVEHCYGCHSNESGLSEGGLRVDSKVAIRAGGGSGPAVVPGDLRGSLLIQAIRYEKEDFAMPPEDAGGKLDRESIAILEEWIKTGAADPRTGESSTPMADRYAQAKEWWAFQPIGTSVPPTRVDTAWCYSGIDAFVSEGYRKQGLHPVGDASPEALLRRVCFDLIGLPPTVEEQATFAKMLSKGATLQEALGKVVDALLASDQFGMHWGRHWLDVARYAESSGREANVSYPHAWRYRDYVIQAWNDNMPYDQFLKEQIAGDLLPAKGSQDRVRQTIATGFLAIGSKTLTERNPRQFAVDQADEQIDTVFQATMGLTVACARCHDHKFDPIPQRDYTALSGIFLSTETKFGTNGSLQARNSASLAELPPGLPVARPTLAKEEVERMKSALANLKAEQAELIEARRKESREGNPNPNPNLLRLNSQISALEGEIAGYESGGSPKALAMAVSDKSGGSRPMGRRDLRRNRGSAFESLVDSPLFVRGDISTAGSVVPRGLLTMFESSASVKIPRQTSGRLQLAEWIISAENPMTSRVAVNRIWYWLMGQGLVSSLDNFGSTGDAGSHPELLDYLAKRYQENGWNTKALIREIVLSHTYQLSTQHDEENLNRDPENRYLWRANRERLSAEAIRDAILAASGRLDGTPHVASTIGRIGDGVIGSQRLAGISEDRIMQTNAEYRSVYLPIARGVVPEILETFDLPDGSAVQTLREATNVPSQALFMLNNGFLDKQAKEVAKRLVEAHPGKRGLDAFEERLDLAYRLMLGRLPDSSERESARALLQKQNGDAEKGWTSLARALYATAEFRYVD